MPLSKNQLSRFKIINSCLTSKRKKYWGRKDILEAFSKQDIEVSKRCLSKDIDLMKFNENLGLNAPIEYCSKNRGYHYTDPNYSIEKIPLSKDEFQVLADTLSLLKYRYAFKDFESVIDKLMRISSGLTTNLNTDNIIEFEKAPYYAGEIHIDPIFNCIRAKQPLSLHYKKFGADEASNYVIHPYFLKEYRNRWYVLTYNEEAEDMRTFALDRILKIEENNTVFKPCPLTNPADYFKDIIGVTRPTGPVEEIILSFAPSLGPYLLTQSLHPSQEILEDNENEFRIKLLLIPNYELYTTLLGYGKKVKVLSPNFISEEMTKV